VQFAGVRTDEDLNIIGDPLTLYCKPANDMLPQPESCVITGITPQMALAKGISEADLIKQIHQEFSQPGTCVVGYNSIRFDDEFTRNSLYRNFFDPYAREWQNGCSRWDIIDVVRLTRALRPEGIKWPIYGPGHAEGKPSNKLEDLTIANGISHESAHDALSDVYATIALAQLIKTQQPKLFDYAYSHRNKRKIFALLDTNKKTPIIHVSGMYSSDYTWAAAVVPIAPHPTNKNAIIVFDLRSDPAVLLTLSKAEISKRLFTPAADLPEGIERIPLKVIHANKCPIVVPLNTMDGKAAKRLKIDLTVIMNHLKSLTIDKALVRKIQSVYSDKVFETSANPDPDHSLYSGGFFNAADKAKMDLIRAENPENLVAFKEQFDDERIPEMLFRYRARNYYETLTDEEKARWELYRLKRLTSEDGGSSIIFDDYIEKIKEMRTAQPASEKLTFILDELVSYGTTLIR